MTTSNLRKLKIKRFLAFVFFVCCPAIATQAQYFPFSIPGDDAASTVVDRSVLSERPAGKHGFIKSKNGHFFAGDKRIRFWGVNLCFGANFPTHEEADLLAPHLAKLGINAVRFHHMDMQDAPNGLWGDVDANGKRQFDPEAIDRLDYFLAKLHEVGVYADINLHVSRTLTEAEGFPQYSTGVWWSGTNKWVTYYDPDVQSELKRFSKDLLTHVNPYRKLRRVDDPGVALVEMLNENFFSKQGHELYFQLPKKFQASFEKKWNDWLKTKYGTNDKMIAAWRGTEKGLGPRLFPVADFKSDLGAFQLNGQGTRAKLIFDQPAIADVGERRALKIVPQATTENDYQQQLQVVNLSCEKNQPVTLAFWARSEANRPLKIEFSSLAGDQWRSLGLIETVKITPVWQRIIRVMTPEETLNKQAYLAFSFGDNITPLEVAGIEFRTGTEPKTFPKSANLENSTVPVPDVNMPAGSLADVKQFMIDTERDWLVEFRRYLKDDLGVRVPITASQINYHADGLVEELCDFADLHTYWHHPMFPPGKDWSASEWTVGNEPLEAFPTKSNWPTNSMLMRTGWRIHNKPMSLTEWNYPEPSVYAVGCVPLAAALGCIQDWDAIFFFDYEAFSTDPQSGRPFFKTATNNFFSFNTAPNKLAALSVFSNLFVRGDLKPLNNQLLSTPDKPIDGKLAFTAKLAVDSKAAITPTPNLPNENDLSTPDGSLIWKSDPPLAGYLQLNTPATQGVWGIIDQQKFKQETLELDVGDIHRDYGVLVASSVDGRPLQETNKIVLLAATHSENVGMKWNETRTSVGTNWGHGPTQIVAIPADIVLTTKSKTVMVHALDGTGKPTKQVPASIKNGQVHFSIGEAYQTLWYAIELGE